MTEMKTAAPAAPKTRWYQKLFRNSFFRVAVVGGGIALGTALLLRSCGPKKEVPSTQPAVAEVARCCPKGYREEKKDIKNGFQISCLVESYCGDGICDTPKENAKNCKEDCPTACGDGLITGKEECDTKSTEKNQGCKDEKKECRDVKNSCKCVDKKRIPKCGDGICDKPKENPKNCPQDCPPERKDGGVPVPQQDAGVKDEKPEVECTPGNATTLNASGQKMPFRKMIKAIHNGVMNLKPVLAGSDIKSVTVTILICPPGGRGSAKVLNVSGAKEHEESVKASVNELLKSAGATQEIREPQKITEPVEVP